MKIIIDADACPKGVKFVCETLANKYEIELVMVIDDSHELKGDYTVIRVAKGNDAVDHKINEISKKDDIIITQDYGLATILLEKVYAVLHPEAFQYTKFNIDTLMFQRHMGQKIRQGGGRIRGPKKRKIITDTKFEELLNQILIKKLKN